MDAMFVAGDPRSFARYLVPLRDQEWVVYAKPPFGGPDRLLDYLGRYIHRVAISNHRLKDLKDGKSASRTRTINTSSGVK